MEPPAIEIGAGLPDAEVYPADPQAQYDLVLAHYLSENISLGRAAELLRLPWLDLRSRFIRLDIPLRLGPANIEEARQEVANLIQYLDSEAESR
jgi:predicted HTH domain antitoxin